MYVVVTRGNQSFYKVTEALCKMQSVGVIQLSLRTLIIKTRVDKRIKIMKNR